LRTRPQNLAILITVIALAVALTFAASGGALARSTFQSSILPTPESTATFTSVPVLTPVAGDYTATPFNQTAPPSPTFTIELTPTQPTIVDTTPTASSFLPPPTLVNPNALVPGRRTPLAPDNRPLAGPAVPPEPTPTEVSPVAPGAAELIDSGVVALSYLWLCCGVLLLAAAGLAVLWLWRRSKRR
jgi:hypothetical protein